MEYMRENTKHYACLRLDARTKLFLSACIFGVVFFSHHAYSPYLSVLIMGIVLAMLGKVKTSIKYAICFLCSALLLHLASEYGFSIAIIPPFLLMYLYKLIPLAMSASMISTSPSGELLAALNKLHVPQGIILPVAVAARFAPTISSEIKAIVDAMRIRGIMGANGKTLLHPLRTFEYVLVPMVIRSLKIADELSASAVARGIECRRKRDSYYEMRIGFSDIASMIIGLAAAIVFILI